MFRLFLAFFIGIPLVFIGLGTFQAVDQQRKLTTWRRVTATIVSSGIERRVTFKKKGGTSVTYQPTVTYRFEVAGHSYSSQNVTPLAENSTSAEWARRIAAEYAQDKPATAYY